MPIVRIGTQLVYFAHIPKCAGSSVEDYLSDRFGRLAFLDRHHLSVPEVDRWTRTSPQHVDWASLVRIFPPQFFDAVLAIVRHPLSRAVSAYRFQAEVEGTMPQGMSFGDWLVAEAESRRADPYRSDNHSRPQSDFLPHEDGPPVAIFHLEHGLDALIPWLDALAGDCGGGRAMGQANKAGERVRHEARLVVPTPEEITLVARLYAADFARFGYAPDRSAPLAPPPQLDATFLEENLRARTRSGRSLYRLTMRLRRNIRKRLQG